MDETPVLRRVGAAVVDGAFIAVVAPATVLVLAEMVGPVAALVGGGLVMPLAFYVSLEALVGRTAGKQLFGIAVVGEDGRSPPLRALVLRNLLRPVDFTGLYLLGGVVMLVTDRKQRLGDLAAGTVVVRTD